MQSQKTQPKTTAKKIRSVIRKRGFHENEVLYRELARAKRIIIARTLLLNEHNRAATAVALGVSRRKIQHSIAELGLTTREAIKKAAEETII